MKKIEEQPEDFYTKFEEKLTESQVWPGPYLFKFILKSDSNHFSTLQSFFNGKKTKWKKKSSAKKTFVSISIYADMDSPQEVITLYKKVSQLEGIISL